MTAAGRCAWQLCSQKGQVAYGSAVARRGAAGAVEYRGSFGPNVLDHLAADRTGFAGCQVAVVALLQIDADFRSGLHLNLSIASRASGTLIWLLLFMLLHLLFFLFQAADIFFRLPQC